VVDDRLRASPCLTSVGGFSGDFCRKSLFGNARRENT
jgi:hypothetical protein